MRIISGMHRGRKIHLPKDTKTIRPTSDFVREAMFNVLAHGRFNDNVNVVQDAVVADICSGSGALGLEALSRGAAHVTFADQSREALDIVRKNIEHFKEADRSHILSADVTNLPYSKHKHDVILMDPPYHKGMIPAILHGLETQGWLAGEAIIIAERDMKDEQSLPENFELVDQRNYGRTSLDVMRYHQSCSA